MEKKQIIRELYYLSISLCAFFLGVMFTYIMIFQSHPILYSSIFIRPAMQLYSDYELNDSFVNKTSNFCSAFSEDTELQVRCVLAQIEPYYNFTGNHDKLYTVNETLEKGGVCRDYALLYHAIFTKMDYYCDYVFLPDHVYVTIYNNEAYCNIDAQDYDCRYFE